MVRSKSMTSLKGLLAASLLALCANVQAAPLDLTLLDSPDVASFFISVLYNPGTDTLSADGFALQVNAGAEGSFAIVGGLYMLQANIDDAGNLLGGSITITGTVADLGYNTGTLLTGVLTDFGFGASDPLEFLFTPTGGDMASEYGNLGGIILSQTGFGGNFEHAFGNSTGVSDVAAIPVPAALWLMLSALAGLVGVRRR